MPDIQLAGSRTDDATGGCSISTARSRISLSS